MRHLSMMKGAIAIALCAAGCAGDEAEDKAPAADKTFTCADTTTMANACDGVAECSGGEDELSCEVVRVESMALSSVALSGDLDGALEVSHHARVQLGLKIKGADAQPGLLFGVVGLVERGVELDKAHRCTLGGFEVIADASGEEALVMVDAAVPTDCLPQGATSASMAVWVGIDPVQHAQLADGSPASRVIVLDAAHEADHAGCEAEDGGACTLEVTLKPSGGLNFSMGDLEPVSSVAILFPDTLPYAWKPYPDGTPMPQLKPPLVSVNNMINVVGSDAPVMAGASVEFALRPVAVYAEDPEQDSFMWRPLTSARGDRARASGHALRWELDAMVPDATTSEPFDLYAEGETYAALARDGEWAEYGVFELRGCVVPKAAEHRADGEQADVDNCATTELVVANARTPSGAANTDVFSFGEGPWSDGWGSSSTERLSVGFKVLARAGLGGIGTSNYLYARLRGWVDYDIVDARLWAKLPGKLDDNGYLAELTLFDDVVFTRGNSWEGAANYNANLWPNYSWSDDLCLSWSYNYVIDFQVRSCVVGTIGLRNEGLLHARRGRITRPDNVIYDNSAELGIYIKPYLDVDLTASATVDAYVARGGARGTINIIDAALTDFAGSSRGAGPTAHFKFEGDNTKTPQTKIIYGIDVDAYFKLKTLSGSLNLWADYYTCDLEIDFWNSSCGYASWFNKRIATWTGIDASFDLLHRQILSRLITGGWSAYFAALDGL
jgi:hypothetical protein